MTVRIEQLTQAVDRAANAAAQLGTDLPEVEGLGALKLRANKLARAWGRPQALGFFGPSQAGKSFLVGALLSQELGTLNVVCRQRSMDFLKEINPAKGVESTGVVTRFSTAPPRLPLKSGDFYCRVLTLEVVLESLATGFLAECTSPAPDVERVDRAIREARLASGPSAPPAFAEAWHTVWHNLAKRYADRHPYLQQLRGHKELRGGGFTDGVKSQTGWLHIFALLWGGHGYAKDVDALAARLLDGLAKLHYAEDVEIGLDHVRASSDVHSVIDAACLNSLGTSRAVIPVYDAETGRSVELEPGVLAALIAEIRLQLEPVSGSLFGSADLLDFPGGRALKGMNGFGPNELNSGRLDNAIEVFKRGKLTFLFEQFSLEREITALVLCSPGPTKPEAIQLQSQVESWLRIRSGSNVPTEREELDHPSLFIALTKYDMSLGALRSDNARDRWDSRIEEACVEFWARSHNSWILNWGEKGKPFNNMFWVRNPYADQMQTLAPGNPDYDAVKQGYFDARSVRLYMADPKTKWQAVEGTDEAGLPRSGVPLLASHLRSKLSVDIKARELQAEAEAIREELIDLVKVLTPSTDDAERRLRLEEQAQSFVASIRNEMNRHYSGAVFGQLVNSLVAPKDELEDELRSVWRIVRPMSIKASDKVKRVLVHLLKWYAQRAADRVRDSALNLPQAQVERFAREVCTSKSIMPILGKAVFPYFSRSELDFHLIATILEVKISDAMLHLFSDQPRQTPQTPVRLSYSESAGVSSEGGEAVDWSDVSFEDDAPSSQVGAPDIVFAGSRYLEPFCERLPAFYVESAGGVQAKALDQPGVRELIDILKELGTGHVSATGPA